MSGSRLPGEVGTEADLRLLGWEQEPPGVVGEGPTEQEGGGGVGTLALPAKARCWPLGDQA